MRIQKTLLAASIAAAVSGVSGVAHAGALGAANEIFIGGATAPQNFAREDLMIRVCDGAVGDTKVYVDEIEVMPSAVAGGDILEQGDHFVVRCTTKTTFGSALDGVDLAVYKFNGGSATGVAPVADPVGASAGDKTYLDADPAACASAGFFPIGTTGDSYELLECDTAATPSLLKVQNPDAGISDVEPSLFVDSLALSFGVEPRGVAAKPTQPFANQGNLVVVPGPGLIFGTAVTLPMYDELQDSQFAAGLLTGCTGIATRADRDRAECMPSLPAALVKSVFAGQVTSWAGIAPYGLPMSTASVTGIAGGGNDVAICKRTNGSGTHAQFSVEFLGTNCGGDAMLEQNDGLAFNPAGFVGVFANSGSSDMNDCLDALGNGAGFDGDFDGLPPENFAGTGDSTVVPGSALPAIAIPGDPLGRSYNQTTSAFAMGYNSTENNTSLSFDYRFIKINGVAPTIENAVTGEYTDVYYLSYQHRVAGGQADLQTGGIRTSAATAAQIAVADAYFDVYNNVAAAAISKVNEGFEVDPDGVAGSGDEWQGGFVTPTAGAAMAYTVGVPETAFSRQAGNGSADSCQSLSFVK